MCESQTYGNITTTPVSALPGIATGDTNARRAEETLRVLTAELPDSVGKILLSQDDIKHYTALALPKRFPYIAAKLTALYMAKANSEHAAGRPDASQGLVDALQKQLAYFEKLLG